MHPYTTENTAFWFYLCCSWTVQRLNLTYLVFCGLDLFGSLPEWISLCAGSEEQSGKCAKRSTMGEAVGSVHRYPRICSGCCNTAMCQMTVSESRTPAFSVRVLCAFSWQRVPLDSVVLWFSRTKLYFSKGSTNISTLHFKKLQPIFLDYFRARYKTWSNCNKSTVCSSAPLSPYKPCSVK